MLVVKDKLIKVNVGEMAWNRWEGIGFKHRWWACRQ